MLHGDDLNRWVFEVLVFDYPFALLVHGDEAVSGFAKVARNSFGEKRNGAGRVGDEEEDLVHVLVVDGAVVMAGGASESLDYHFPGLSFPSECLGGEERKKMEVR
jgi:hypothetical protein